MRKLFVSILSVHILYIHTRWLLLCMTKSARLDHFMKILTQRPHYSWPPALMEQMNPEVSPLIDHGRYLNGAFQTVLHSVPSFKYSFTYIFRQRSATSFIHLYRSDGHCWRHENLWSYKATVTMNKKIQLFENLLKRWLIRFLIVELLC